MAFSEEVKKQIFEDADSECEECGKQLVFSNHDEGEKGAWEAHHIVAVSDGGKDTAGNGKALCLDCHKKTKSYGSH
jgi:5-methylcytosine-specific restriction endonuclease McrA